MTNADCDVSLPLQGQVAVVTGGATGLGAAICVAFAAAGAAVVMDYKAHADEAQQLIDAIHARGGRARAVQADVSKPEDVTQLFERAIAKFGTVDILVANAGLQKDAAFLEMTPEQWQATLNVDLSGQFLCMQAAAREFVRRGVVESVSRAAGKIVCMSSVHQVIPWAGHVNYAAAKGGVDMLMKSVAQELAPQRIRVNAIAPGAIRTPINQSVWGDAAKDRKLLELIPYGRIGEPEDVARAAVWLASDESDYVTGATLFVDGGMSLYPAFRDNG